LPGTQTFPQHSSVGTLVQAVLFVMQEIAVEES
jgi:hypothetical protein